MKQYVVAFCIPEESAVKKSKVLESIKNAFYNKIQNSEQFNVIAMDFYSLSKSNQFSGSYKIQKDIIGQLDAFLFTPETLENPETRDYILKAININGRFLNSKRNRTIGTDFINIYNSKETPKQVEAMDLLKQNYNSISFVSWEEKKLEQNLIGNVNSRNLVRNVIKNTERDVVEIIGAMFEKFRETDNKYTIDHVSMVTVISEQIAKKLEYEKEEIDCVKAAAILHDYGKQYIPSEITNTPGILTEEEFKVMKTHSTLGAVELLKENKSEMLNHAINACYQHHERVDGKGYPLGLKGDEIDEVARIVAIADSFQAMLGRSYKKPMTFNHIVQEFEKCSTKDIDGNQQFDTRITKAFLEILHDKQICNKMGIFWNNKDDFVRYEVPSLKKLGYEKEEEKIR